VRLPVPTPGTFDAFYHRFCDEHSWYKHYWFGEGTWQTVLQRNGTEKNCWWGFAPCSARSGGVGAGSWQNKLCARHVFVASAFMFRSMSDDRDMARYVADFRDTIPKWMQTHYPDAAHVLTKYRMSWRARDPGSVLAMCRSEWVRLRNEAYATCRAVHASFVEHYRDGIKASAAGDQFQGCLPLVELIANYAAGDLPFRMPDSRPLLTVLECTPSHSP
jgi:hypothetical protein